MKNYALCEIWEFLLFWDLEIPENGYFEIFDYVPPNFLPGTAH